MLGKQRNPIPLAYRSPWRMQIMAGAVEGWVRVTNERSAEVLIEIVVRSIC